MGSKVVAIVGSYVKGGTAGAAVEAILRRAAQILGARPVGHMWIGLSAMEPKHPLSARDRQRARRIGWKLA